MKSLFSLSLLCMPLFIFASQENIDIIFNQREVLAKTFLDLAHNHTSNYVQARNHLLAHIKNDPQYIVCNNPVILELPTALFAEVDNEEICTNSINSQFLENLNRDRSCVQNLFALYTKKDISTEDLSEKTNKLIDILTDYSKQYE